jgi:hypothetical protein
MPKLQYCRGSGDIWAYINMCHLDEGACMISWRAADAPIFTLAYRGSEVDALQAIEEKNSSIESSDMSRTVLFSHSTGECFVAKKSIHLHPGDPQLIIQGVVDVYDQGLVTSLKIVDVVSESKARDRVAIVQTLEKKLEARRAAGGETSNRLGAMWCGEVTRASVCGMLSLRTSGGMMRHKMGSVVILTGDPFLQVHTPLWLTPLAPPLPLFLTPLWLTPFVPPPPQVHMSVDEVDQKIRKSPVNKRASLCNNTSFISHV